MNMLDALKVLADNNQKREWKYWARPISWRTLRMAIAKDWDGPGWKIVPGSRGGHDASMPCIEDMLDEWEVVEADLVNDGK